MSESLSLLSSGGGSGGGGGGGSGVICLLLSVELSSMELLFPSVVFVVSSSTNSRLVSNYFVDVQLQLSVCSFECSMSSKAIFGRRGAPSCVGKSKWILRLEGTA